jgi:hypothetical protein
MRTAARRRPSTARASASSWLGLVLASLLGAACGGNGTAPPPISATGPLAGAPGWVMEDCSVHWPDDDTGRLCGVGSVAGTRNISLARTTAIGRARSEIGRTLQARVRSMLEDYSASDDAQDFGDDPAQYIQDVSKQITQLTLSGSSLEDTWVGPDGTLYTLVALDVEGFRNALDQMTTLSPPIREAVKSRADSAFREADEAAE